MDSHCIMPGFPCVLHLLILFLVLALPSAPPYKLTLLSSFALSLRVVFSKGQRMVIRKAQVHALEGVVVGQPLLSALLHGSVGKQSTWTQKKDTARPSCSGVC